MKKFRSILPLLLCCITPYLVNAQIKGTIVDNSKSSIEYATIVLIENDSTIVKGTTSDMNGIFTFEMPTKKGKYEISITCIGFEKKQISIITKEKVLDLGQIILNTESQQLSELIITANRIQRNRGGYFVNLHGEESAQGKQADEILKSLPGITHEDGSLKVLGQNVSVIYLDGIRIKDQKELESIPAEMLQSAQIDYMAGSKEMASIKGAVIHIKLKKQRDNGYFGNVMAGVTFMTKYGFTGDNLSSVYNYRLGKLSIYNNLSYNDRQATGDYVEQKRFKDTGTEINSTEKFRSWSRNFYNRLSLTYDFNKDKTLGNSFYISSNRANPINNIISSYQSGGVTTPQKSSLETPYRYTLYQLKSNYHWNTDDNGSNFDITVDYLHNDENDDTKATVYRDELAV